MAGRSGDSSVPLSLWNTFVFPFDVFIFCYSIFWIIDALFSFSSGGKERLILKVLICRSLLFVMYIYICLCMYVCVYICVCGPGSVVGIATDYGLDGPGIESRWGRNFPHLSRPTLKPTQPPVKRGTWSFPGVKCGRGVTLTLTPF